MREHGRVPNVSTYSDLTSAWAVAEVIVYNAAISACEKGQQQLRAMALVLLEALRYQCLLPEAIIYNALISACEKGDAAPRPPAGRDPLQCLG